MYIRFVTPEPANRRRGHYGLFAPAVSLSYDSRTPKAHRLAIREELDWFNANLPIPSWRSFSVKSRGRYYDDGICWFRDDARDMVRHAFILKALLDDLGIPIGRLHTEQPGQILYRDDWQIVAKPEAATPVRWA